MFNNDKQVTVEVMVMCGTGEVRRNVQLVGIMTMHHASLIITRKGNELHHWKDRYFRNWQGPLPADMVETLVEWHAYAATKRDGRLGAR